MSHLIDSRQIEVLDDATLNARVQTLLGRRLPAKA